MFRADGIEERQHTPFVGMRLITLDDGFGELQSGVVAERGGAQADGKLPAYPKDRSDHGTIPCGFLSVGNTGARPVRWPNGTVWQAVPP